jgi:cytoskeletal protein CcmA (bactofilin family)
MFDRKPQNPSERPTRESDRLSRRFADAAGATDTVVGGQACLNGDISGRTNIEIRGAVEGTCDVEGLVTVCEGGSVTGEVRATNAIVEGQIKGNVRVTQKLEMRSSCHIEGDIRAAILAMAEGSSINGRIDMSDAQGGAGTKPFQEKRRHK